MDWPTWYDQLAKPSWTPSPAAISTIWMILYPIIALSFGFVFYQVIRGRLPHRVAWPFILNLIANLLFMPIFAGLRNVPLAAADILVVLGSIVWMMWSIWPHHRIVAAAQVPYLLWVSVATVLQLSITAMNW